MGDHRVAHKISSTDFDANAIEAEHRRYCINHFEEKSASNLDRAAVVFVPVVEVTDQASR